MNYITNNLVIYTVPKILQSLLNQEKC